MSKNVQSTKILTPKQRRAVAALISGYNHQEAAAAASVAPKTIQRWLRDDTFAAELERQTSGAVIDAARRLAGTLNMSIDVFQEIMGDDQASDTLRLRAANFAAQHALKWLETAEIMRRLEAIEQSIGISQ